MKKLLMFVVVAIFVGVIVVLGGVVDKATVTEVRKEITLNVE